MQKLSIIVPLYNEAEVLETLIQEVMAQTKDLNLEKTFYFINDGSTDGTLEVLKQEIEKNRSIRIHYISFSRNFGKEAALLAGLQACDGDFVTIMDADLQDPPKLLSQMYEKLLDGYDVVGARRVSRKGEPFIRSIFSKLFYKLINKLSQTKILPGSRDYRLMSRQVVDSILELKERNRFSKGLLAWVGYQTYYLEYENVERYSGTTSWNFSSLLKYSIDGFINFSETPLNLATYIGLFGFLFSIAMGGVFFVKAVVWGDKVRGFSTLVVLVLMLGSLQLLSLGIIGKYIAKIFLESKKRPVYIVKESSL